MTSSISSNLRNNSSILPFLALRFLVLEIGSPRENPARSAQCLFLSCSEPGWAFPVGSGLGRGHTVLPWDCFLSVPHPLSWPAVIQVSSASWSLKMASGGTVVFPSCLQKTLEVNFPDQEASKCSCWKEKQQGGERGKEAHQASCCDPEEGAWGNAK